MSRAAGSAVHGAAASCSAALDELAAAATSFNSEDDSNARDGLGVDLEPIESGSRKRRERPGQSEAACMLGNGVDAAPKESEDVAEQVMSATLHTASTRCAPPLASCGSTDFVL